MQPIATKKQNKWERAEVQIECKSISLKFLSNSLLSPSLNLSTTVGLNSHLFCISCSE